MTAETSSDQARAADPSLSVFVSANAGSGKTSTLVNRVARILLGGTDPGAVLCVTFTKAAAAEMQSRLFERLGGWAVMDDDRLTQELVALEGRGADTYDQGSLSRARQLFARALETPGGLKIQTLHAFCEKLLRRFPLEAGVSPRFRVLEDEAAHRLSRQAREALARAALADGEGPLGQAWRYFVREMDFQAFEGLLATLEARRLDLTAYIEAVAAGLAPDIHALTGTGPNQTLKGLEADWRAALDEAELRALAAELALGSANDVKKSQALSAAIAGGLAFADLWPVFMTKEGAAQKSMATARIPLAVKDRLVALQADYVALWRDRRALLTAERTRHALTLAGVHAALYVQAKSAVGALDFSDLVDKARGLLTRADASAWVLYKLDGGIDHVLVDEAQDTAPDQWAILTALTGEFFAGHGLDHAVPRTVFAVGDEKQSIYSFQGARPERLRLEAQAYDRRITAFGGLFQGVDLTTSYRSTPEVLAFVDAVFALPERARSLTGDSLAASPDHGPSPAVPLVHQAARTDHAGSVELWPLFQDDAAPEADPWVPVDHEPVTHGRKKLARALAREIRRAITDGDAVHDKTHGWRPCGPDDFLILVRRRDATFEEIIRALKAEGLPVAGADRLRLSEHIAFEDIKAVMRFALFPGDDLSLAEMLRGPFCEVPDFDGADSLHALAGREGRAGLWHELRARAGEQASWRAACDLADWALAARDREAFGFASGLLNRVDASGLSGRGRVLERLGREAGEALDETLSLLLALDRQGVSDLETVLARLEAAEVEVKRDLEGPRGEVRIMTVHGAKGLEAPVVFLPDTTSRGGARSTPLFEIAMKEAEAMASSASPWLMGGRRLDDCEALAAARDRRAKQAQDESLRLFYVGLTRARDRLVLMGRALGGVRTGYHADSWWAVAEESFARLREAGPGRVRDIGEGRLRFGSPTPVLPRREERVEVEPGLPGWAARTLAPETGLHARRPSQLAGRGVAGGLSPLQRGGAGRPSRLRRGTLIHRLLERLPELPHGQRRGAAERLLAREPGLSPDAAAEITAAAMGVMDDDRFAAVFGPGSRAEVALAGRVEGVAWSGRIDRLVVLPGEVRVIDYKTRRPAPSRIADADPADLAQVAAYAALLQPLYPGRRIRAALVWTDGPRLMPVPLPGEADDEAASITDGTLI